MHRRLTSVLLALAAGACAPATPSSSGSGPTAGKADSERPDTLTETFEHKWAIDMQKVREVGKYEHVTRFVGLSAQQLMGSVCPSPQELTQIQVQLKSGLTQAQQQAQAAAQQMVASGDLDPAGAPAFVEEQVAEAANAALAQIAGGQEAAAGLATCLAASEPETIIDTKGTPDRGDDEVATLGGGYAYGNMQTLRFDHTPYDEANEKPLVNIIDYDDSGNPMQIDPPGYLNVIALHTAARSEQPEIDQYLQNGDVLVYIHPEDRDQHIQFAAHHAAMYYHTGKGPGMALALTDEPFVHHIDNPTSYGPAFNAGKTSTPFHVFRFNPNGAPATPNRDAEGFYKFPCNESGEAIRGCQVGEDGESYFTVTDEMAERYAWVARNWALMNNMNAPFADFQTLTMKELDDLEGGFAKPGIRQMSMEPTYCAGLVGVNLSLAANFPLNEQGLGGDLWETFIGEEYPFDDGYLGAELPGRRLQDPWEAKGVDPLPKLGMLPIDPILPSDILMNWVERYFPAPGMPEAMARKIRAGVLNSDQMKSTVVRRFRVLDWDSSPEVTEKLQRFVESNDGLNGNGTRTTFPPVVTKETVELYSQAYGMGGRPAVEALQHDPCSVPEVAMMRAGFEQAKGDRANPSTLDALTQPSCPEVSEAANVEQRYLYPPIYHVEANRPGSMMSYVGTVIHHELLSPIYGHDGDANTGTVEEFFQGGPDSSQYPHYFVPNGLSHTQRVFEMDSGPEHTGPGTEITTRISAANWKDVRVVLHPPVTFTDRGGELDSRFACEQDVHCLCEDGRDNCMDPSAPADGKPLGVFLPISRHLRSLRVKGQSGVDLERWEAVGGDRAGWVDGRLSWNLFDPIKSNDERFTDGSWGGAGCRQIDGRTMCPVYDYEKEGYAPCSYSGSQIDVRGIEYACLPVDALGEDVEFVDVSKAHGQWTLSVLDVGHDDRNAWGEIKHCSACEEGGAHSNQWVLKVRNDATP